MKNIRETVLFNVHHIISHYTCNTVREMVYWCFQFETKSNCPTGKSNYLFTKQDEVTLELCCSLPGILIKCIPLCQWTIT